MLSLMILLVLTDFWVINGQTTVNRTFIQPATSVGSSTVCVGNSQTFNCTVQSYISSGIGFVMADAIWSRDGVIITDSTPRHTLLRTPFGENPVITGVMVDDINTILNDSGAVYSCTTDGAPDDFISSVTLNVVEDTPTANGTERLDNDTCLETTSHVVSWTPSSCDPVCGPISYNVTISPSEGVMNMSINDTSYSFSGLRPGINYTVTVVGFNMAGTGEPQTGTFSVATTCDSPMAEDNSSITTPTLTATNTTNSSKNNGNSDNMIIIIIIVVILVAIAVVIIVVSIILCRRHLKEKAKIPIEQKENEENQYAQANSDQQENKENLEYAYASNGPRGIAFLSTNSEMPQKQ